MLRNRVAKPQSSPVTVQTPTMSRPFASSQANSVDTPSNFRDMFRSKISQAITSAPSDSPQIQRFTVQEPSAEKERPKVDTTVNKLNFNQSEPSINYGTETKTDVSLRVSDDGKMVVPNVSQSKDFYADQDVLKQSEEILAAQNSAIKLTPTGQTILIAGRPLAHVKPISRKDSGKLVEAINNAQSFVDVCIEMAHQVTTGGWGKFIAPVTKAGIHESFDSKAPYNPTTANPLRKKFPASQAQSQGFNQYASPDIGEMLTTLNLSHRKKDFEYHFAGVIAKSGNDFVTLENYNRDGEADEYFAELLKTVEYAKSFSEKVAKLQQYYDKEAPLDTREKTPEEIEQDKLDRIERIKDQALREFIEARNILSGNQFSNTKVADVKGALWFFQMYGPADKKVTVDKATKDEEGNKTSSPAEIDQSFHSHMVATDDFGEAMTLRVGTVGEYRPNTGGVQKELGMIKEPAQAGFWDKLVIKTEAKKDAESIKQRARALAGNCNSVTIDQVRKLDSECLKSTNNRSIDKARYILNILKLYLAIKDKCKELDKCTKELSDMDTAQLKRLAGMSSGFQRRIDSIINIMAKLEGEVSFYRESYAKVKSHVEFRKNTSFPDTAQGAIEGVVLQMAEKLEVLKKSHAQVKQELTS